MFALHKLNFTKPAFQNNMSSSTPSFTNPSNQGIRTNLLFVNKPRNQLSDKKNNFAYLPPCKCLLKVRRIVRRSKIGKWLKQSSLFTGLESKGKGQQRQIDCNYLLPTSSQQSQEACLDLKCILWLSPALRKHSSLPGVLVVISHTLIPIPLSAATLQTDD